MDASFSSRRLGLDAHRGQALVQGGHQQRVHGLIPAGRVAQRPQKQHIGCNAQLPGMLTAAFHQGAFANQRQTALRLDGLQSCKDLQHAPVIFLGHKPGHGADHQPVLQTVLRPQRRPLVRLKPKTPQVHGVVNDNALTLPALLPKIVQARVPAAGPVIQ